MYTYIYIYITLLIPSYAIFGRNEHELFWASGEDKQSGECLGLGENPKSAEPTPNFSTQLVEVTYIQTSDRFTGKT